MMATRLEFVAWMLAGVLTVTALLRLQGLHDEVNDNQGFRPSTVHVLRAPLGDSVVRAAAWVESVNPFRLSRRPAQTPYQPELEGAQAAALPPTPPKPTLVVAGIVGGPPWKAVVEGIPGRDGGVIVRAGDTVDGLVVRRVGPSEVIIDAADTTWKLTIRSVW